MSGSVEFLHAAVEPTPHCTAHSYYVHGCPKCRRAYQLRYGPEAVNRHELEVQDEAIEAPTDVDTDPFAEFWDQRDILKHIRAYAQATYVGPWALLGVVLARTVASTDPDLQLYRMLNSPASLNLFVALCARSGGGKGRAERAGRVAVEFRCGSVDVEIEEHSPGSGEGIARLFDKDQDCPPRRALLTSSEIDGLMAMGSRQGSTLLSQLRKVYSGESLGFLNANRKTRTVVPHDSYRACMLLGVQHLRAGALFDDSAGGTPQRFLFMPTADDNPPDTCEVTDPPAPMVIDVPAASPSYGLTYIETPESMNREFREFQHAVRCGAPVDELDGHKMLTRAKVAAALAILDGRCKEVTEQDWRLAGIIIRISDRTRHELISAVANEAKAKKHARRVDKADDDDYAADRADLRLAKRARDAVLRAIDGGRTKRKEIRDSMRSELKSYLTATLDELTGEGEITCENGMYKRM